MGFRLLQHEPEPAAINRVLPPGGLRKKAGEIGFVGTVEDAAGDIGHALVGQDDQPGQIVLESAETGTGSQTGRGRPPLDRRPPEQAPQSAIPSHTPLSSSASSAWSKGSMTDLSVANHNSRVPNLMPFGSEATEVRKVA